MRGLAQLCARTIPRRGRIANSPPLGGVPLTPILPSARVLGIGNDKARREIAQTSFLKVILQLIPSRPLHSLSRASTSHTNTSRCSYPKGIGPLDVWRGTPPDTSNLSTRQLELTFEKLDPPCVTRSLTIPKEPSHHSPLSRQLQSAD